MTKLIQIMEVELFNLLKGSSIRRPPKAVYKFKISV